MNTTLLLATALLTASLVPLASAGLADDYAPAPGVCDINDPPVDYVLCLLGDPNVKEVVDRVKAEAAWQQAAVTGAAAFYGGVGNAVVSSTLDFEGRQVPLTTVLVRNVETRTVAYVNYLAGVPFGAVSYADGVLEGECRFWVSAGGCPVFSTARSDSGLGLLDGTGCDPGAPVLTYALCRADEVYAEVMVLADKFGDHYTAVGLGAANYALVTGLTFYSQAAGYGVTLGIYGLNYGLATAGNGLTYASDLGSDTAGVPGYTTDLAYAECGRLWSQCPRLVVGIDLPPLVLS